MSNLISSNCFNYSIKPDTLLALDSLIETSLVDVNKINKEGFAKHEFFVNPVEEKDVELSSIINIIIHKLNYDITDSILQKSIMHEEAEAYDISGWQVTNNSNLFEGRMFELLSLFDKIMEDKINNYILCDTESYILLMRNRFFKMIGTHRGSLYGKEIIFNRYINRIERSKGETILTALYSKSAKPIKFYLTLPHYDKSGDSGYLSEYYTRFENVDDIYCLKARLKVDE